MLNLYGQTGMTLPLVLACLLLAAWAAMRRKER